MEGDDDGNDKSYCWWKLAMVVRGDVGEAGG